MKNQTNNPSNLTDADRRAIRALWVDDRRESVTALRETE